MIAHTTIRPRLKILAALLVGTAFVTACSGSPGDEPTGSATKGNAGQKPVEGTTRVADLNCQEPSFVWSSSNSTYCSTQGEIDCRESCAFSDWAEFHDYFRRGCTCTCNPLMCLPPTQ
jgi:hypothetical protein